MKRVMPLLLSLCAVLLMTCALADYPLEHDLPDGAKYDAATGTLTDNNSYVPANRYQGWTELQAIVLTNATSVGTGGFEGCTGIKTATATNLETINDYSFYKCTALTSVELPRAKSLGGGCFHNCTSLENVSLPLTESLGDICFSGCTSLVSVSLPLAESIGNNSFFGCKSLESVSLPLAEYIGYDCFSGCTSLASISLPLAKSIDIGCFSRCTSLASVSLPLATNINNYCFSGCTSLESVSLPLATTIYSDCFYGCTSLQRVCIPTVSVLSGSTFFSCSSLNTVVLGAMFSSVDGDTVFPGACSAKIYTPTGTTENVKTIFGKKVPPQLHNNIVEYEATTIRPNIFISDALPSANCVVHMANGTTFDVDHEGLNVDTNGNVTKASSNQYSWTITSTCKANVAGFNDIPVMDTCYVQWKSIYAEAESLTDGSFAFVTYYNGMPVYDGTYLRNENNTIYLSAGKNFSIATVDDQWYSITYDGGKGYIPKAFVKQNAFVAATDIENLPTKVNKNSQVYLSGTVVPDNATNKKITWSIVDAGTTNAQINGNYLAASSVGTAKVRATIANGTAIGVDYTKDFDIAVIDSNVFVPVKDITNLPKEATAGQPLALNGAVQPSYATNQNISWRVLSANSTGAAINGNVFTATAAGKATVRATIVNGKGSGLNYTKDFSITVAQGSAFMPVSGVSISPSTMTAGSLVTLTTTVYPSNATNQRYSISIAGGTAAGAALSGSTLTAGGAGTVILRVTIPDGTALGTAFTQDVTITVSGSTGGGTGGGDNGGGSTGGSGYGEIVLPPDVINGIIKKEAELDKQLEDSKSTGRMTDKGLEVSITVDGKPVTATLSTSNFTYDFPSTQKVTVNKSAVLRDGPDGDYDAVMKIKAGSKLNVIGRDGKWLKVKVKGQILYVLDGKVDGLK